MKGNRSNIRCKGGLKAGHCLSTLHGVTAPSARILNALRVDTKLLLKHAE